MSDEFYTRAVDFTLQRSVEDGDGFTLEGYAAVFNTPASIRDRLGEYDEIIAPGAFKRTIAGGRPIMQFDHGTHPVLGSLPIGSITELREDPRGLFVQARIFDNWMTEPLRQAIEAQAVDGMSFKFSVPDGKDKWTVQESGRQLRTVHEIKLFELGPVVHPAYRETSVALRSLASVVPGLTLTLEAEKTTSVLAAGAADAVREFAAVGAAAGGEFVLSQDVVDRIKRKSASGGRGFSAEEVAACIEFQRAMAALEDAVNKVHTVNIHTDAGDPVAIGRAIKQAVTAAQKQTPAPGTPDELAAARSTSEGPAAEATALGTPREDDAARAVEGPAAKNDDPAISHSPPLTPAERDAARKRDWREIEMSQLGIGKQ